MKKLNKTPFKVGDKVTTDYFAHDAAMVRTVIQVRKSDKCSSGWTVVADQGTACEHCHRTAGAVTPTLDSTWFVKCEKGTV